MGLDDEGAREGDESGSSVVVLRWAPEERKTERGFNWRMGGPGGSTK